MGTEDYSSPPLERKCRSQSNIHENVTPWRPSMPSAKCLKKMDRTIMALQHCKETCCCVGMNAHGLQLRSLAVSLPGDTTLIVVYLPAERKSRLQLPCTWMAMPEWEQHSTECDTLRPWRPSMPSAKCLKKMEWTIMALQPCKETCCCVGMNAHGLQLRSSAGSLPGDTTLIVVYLPADKKRRLQPPGAWMEMLEWEQHSTECDTQKT